MDIFHSISKPNLCQITQAVFLLLSCKNQLCLSKNILKSETNDSGRKGQLGPGKRLLYLKKRKWKKLAK